MKDPTPRALRIGVICAFLTACGGNASERSDVGAGGTGAPPRCTAPFEPHAPYIALPWILTLNGASDAGANDSGAAGAAESEAGVSGEGGANDSEAPCSTQGFFPVTKCRGFARVTGTDWAPVLLFDDGSQLSYSSSNPAPALRAGARVWVNYDDKTVPDCPFCGYQKRKSLDIRDREGGAIGFFGLTGTLAQSMPDDVLSQVFGFALEASDGCRISVEFQCQKVTRARLDFVVKSSPEQVLPHAQNTSIVASSGARFNVLLSSSRDERGESVANCLVADDPELYADSTFFVSRVADLPQGGPK